MIDLTGKVAVVFGLANKRSIAYAIAHKLAEAGATLAICYQSERLQREAEALVTELGLEGKAKIFQCDVSRDEEIDAVFAQVKEHYGTIYTVVHAVAFAPAEAIHNDFLLTTREAFRIANDVSVYSLIAISRAAEPLMTEGGSILTLTYLGADKVIPNYNVMGVAKAALQDGAIPRRFAGAEGNSCECDLRGSDQDAGGARDRRPPEDAGCGFRTRSAASRRGPDGGWRNGAVSRFAARVGDYGRGALCGLRIQYNGSVAAFSEFISTNGPRECGPFCSPRDCQPKYEE